MSDTLETKKNNILNSFKNIKKNNILVFLFFFVISSCLWFLMELSKVHSSQIDISLKLENIPYNARISEKSKQKLLVYIEGDGYSLLQEKIDNINLPVTLDFNLMKKNRVFFHKNKDQESEYYILSKDLFNIISLRLNKNIKILDIKPDTIYFFTPENPGEKRVKINNRVKFSLNSDYIVSNEISLSPDSVDIFGPKSIIDSIDFVNTFMTDLGEISNSINEEIQLQNIPDVSFSTNTSRLSIFTERYTERSLELDIKPINLKKGYNIKFIPDKAEVSFKVPLSYYESVNESDILVSADFEKRQNGLIILNFKSLSPKIIITKYNPLAVKFILSKTPEIEESND